MAIIKIPTPLRVYTGDNAQVEVEGSTVASALGNLVAQYPEIEPHLFSDGALRNFVNVFIDDENINFYDGLATEIEANANLRIIPSIAGGR